MKVYFLIYFLNGFLNIKVSKVMIEMIFEVK